MIAVGSALGVKLDATPLLVSVNHDYVAAYSAVVDCVLALKKE